MKKIRKTILFITLLILLLGFVNASEVSEDITDVDIISEELAVKDTDTVSTADVVPLDKESDADLQEDNEYESTENTLKMNNDDDELKEGSEITNWSQLAEAVKDTKNKTGNITITLGNGTYINTHTIEFINNSNAVITINGNGQTIDGNHKQAFIIRPEASVGLANITIKNCNSIHGGAITNHGTLTITQSEFTNNTADYNGGVILNKRLLNVKNSIFSNNKGSSGGAIYNDFHDAILNIANCTFILNTAKNDFTGIGDGGAIQDDFGKSTITQSIFISNNATRGGAIMNHGGGMPTESFTVTQSIFISNNAESEGGAIYSYIGWNHVTDSNFTDNYAPKGAAIAADNFKNINGNRFTGNHAGENNRETIDLHGHKREVIEANSYESTDIALKTVNLELKDNKSIYYGEGVVLNFNIALAHSNYYDLDILEKLEDITIYINGVENVTARYPNYTLSNLKPGEYEVYYKTCSYTSNTVNFTVRPLTNWQQLIDAVDYAKNQKKDITIGLQEGTYINTGTINWTNTNIVLTIDGNGQTIDGNQQQVFYIGSGASMVLKNITIQNAKSEHGAILNSGTLRVVGAALVNNTATYDGGAIASYSKLTVINSTLINNTAYNNGGAIKNGNLHADIINSTFTNNHAVAGGAIFSNGNCNITDNKFTNNTADNRQTIDLYSHKDGQLDSNVYESTDISLKTIELTVKDNQSIFIQDDDVVLNFNIVLKNPYYYDGDILERLEDITIYINGVENVTTNYPNCTLSNLRPGEYTVYYKTCNQKSNNVSFRIIELKEINLKTWDIEMVKGRTATFSAVIDYKNTTINYGKVYFEIDGKPLVRKGSILYAPVENNLADLEYPMPINLPIGNHTITAVYMYDNRILAFDNKTLTIIKNIPEGASDEEEIPSEDGRKQETYENEIAHNKYIETTQSSVPNYSPVENTYTVTRASDNQLICKSNLFILEYLNKLFNMTFINGHIKVYIDGKLIFEGDTTDDLTQAIFEIMDEYLGEHEITVEFTDSEGKSNNYKEKIIVE